MRDGFLQSVAQKPRYPGGWTGVSEYRRRWRKQKVNGLEVRSQQRADNQSEEAEDNRQPSAVAKRQTRLNTINAFVYLVNAFIDLIDALTQVRFHLIDPFVNLIDALIKPRLDFLDVLVNVRKPVFKAETLIIKPLIYLRTEQLNLIAD